MKRVLVAMSGGVDSSVAAALCLKQGYLVEGAYMKNFSTESWQGILQPDCPWEQDVKDAKAVCEKLGIRFRSFNFEREYAEKVIEYFFSEFAAGLTPNPDVMCNKEIKFGLFLQKAQELGFDYIATGHYARIRPVVQNHSERYQLLKGLDPKKDQTYFLYALNQDQLSRTLFPIGKYPKQRVRQIAKQFQLPNWNKKDSQGVCFIGHIKLREFLRQRIPEKTGQLIEASSGKVIGEHPGSWYFTIGQRQGIGIGGGKPYYVMQKDVAKNQLFVTNHLDKQETNGLYSKTSVIGKLNWIHNVPPFPLICHAKIRYQQPDQICSISSILLPGSKGAVARIEFLEAQYAIAQGQSVVLYKRDKVLGGGVVI